MDCKIWTLLFSAGVLLVLGEDVPENVKNLPPILKAPDDLGHNNPVLVDPIPDTHSGSDTPLLGQPDGHDSPKGSIIGQPDGHDNPKGRLIGQPDGHDGASKPLLGQNDGHDNPNSPLLGQNNGHDNPNPPLLGQNDGHDNPNSPLLGQNDGHDNPHPPLFGEDDGHDNPESREESRESEGKSEEGSDENKERDLYNYWQDNLDEYDDHVPVDEFVRCKHMTSCELICDEFGYQTDDRGCLTCNCLEDPCKNYTCSAGLMCVHSECPSKKNCKQLQANCVAESDADSDYHYDDDDDILIKSEDDDDDKEEGKRFPCAMPMCANFCQYGYQYNTNGCMTCDCNEKPLCPNHVLCPMSHLNCANGYVNDEKGCRTCTCMLEGLKKAPERPRCTGPEPMCANHCENGYKYKDNGCMTCDCVETEGSCGEETCDKNDRCKTKTSADGLTETKACVAKPLCLLIKEKGNRLAQMNAAKCESDGSFSPIQCNDYRSECWCVDDRGEVIEETRTSVYVNEHKPRCQRNYTVVAKLQMTLSYNDHNQNINSNFTTEELIIRLLPDALSRCTLIKKDFISVLSVKEHHMADDYYELGRAFEAEVIVRHDGFSDIPSALERFQRLAVARKCPLSVDSQTELSINYETLVIESKFSLTPNKLPLVMEVDNGMYSTEGDWIEYCVNHGYVMIGAALLAGLLLTVFILAFMLIKRRRMRQLSFQRLESQISTNSEKSLLDSRDDNVLLIGSGPIGEKKVAHA